jgi:prephenate dehydrogenase
MTMGVPAPFSRVAVLGTGLIGGSFALAVRQHFPEVEIAGWDRAEVLEQARARGAITQGSTELTAVLRGAELVYLALPVGMILEMLPAVARAVFRKEAHTPYFVGGHPLAGKETSGIAHADPELFRGAKYALIGSGENIDERVARLLRLLETLGAVPVWMDAETHDWAVAIISHLPQMAAVALARVVADETDETGLPLSLAGRGLREALRLAGSPYEIWRDIALTNTDNLARALDRLAQAVDHLRTRLATHELREEFEAANEVYKILRQFE